VVIQASSEPRGTIKSVVCYNCWLALVPNHLLDNIKSSLIIVCFIMAQTKLTMSPRRQPGRVADEDPLSYDNRKKPF